MIVADEIAAILMAGGAAWTLLGVLGLIRFPDAYTRLHGTGLSSTAGIALLLAGVAVHFLPRSVPISVLAVLTVGFVLVTYPLASTAIISAAHRIKSPKVESTCADELEEDEKSASGEADARNSVSGVETE